MFSPPRARAPPRFSDSSTVRLRPQWNPRYYAANVPDPDGYNVEICYKPWLYE
jgi:hypothetical protein